jgi:hypothetical protein
MNPNLELQSLFEELRPGLLGGGYTANPEAANFTDFVVAITEEDHD